ncbi:hypothetical protein BV881_29140 [Streptomyces sp. ZL-24]|uniref:hypothetical protein n=1 Tax=Streptomyces sp. ZL-24 TaxID=1933029 RepID=UPI000CD405A3|nr:hypothetical protein [Streptomyces sp. ZL-24]POG44003.1 hypothetical protein BV881_29140 [Streptomyces sp. ZL-24]
MDVSTATATEAPVAELTKKAVQEAVWEAPDTAPDRKTRPTWWAASYLRAIYGQVATLQRTVTAQTAAITALAGQVGKGADTATVVAVVQQAIRDAVVKVDVDINT